MQDRLVRIYVEAIKKVIQSGVSRCLIQVRELKDSKDLVLC